MVFLCKKINKLFGHQLLLTILTYLIWTIYEMYHLVILWSCENCPQFLIMLALSYTVTQEILIFTILWNCQCTMNEAQRFKTIWYSKLTTKLNIQKNFKKHYFTLINHQVVFSAMGLYVLDMQQFFSVKFSCWKFLFYFIGALFQILGLLLTLIVILTQFSTSV